MTESGAIGLVLSELTNDAVIAANGYISREVCHQRDRDTNFYMLGSMGLASSIALGLAIAQPGRRVVILDGDGNLMMSLGALAMVGRAAPPNLLHVVLDNMQYASTGGQRGLSETVNFVKLAMGAGYRVAAQIECESELLSSIRAARATKGPSFLAVKVTSDITIAPRVPHLPESIVKRFKTACLAVRPV